MNQGYFSINRSTDNQFYFNLVAGNGEVILTSERYTAKANAQGGIESVKLNAPLDDHYRRLEASNGQPYFTLRAVNHEVIGSSQRYSSKQAREDGIGAVKANAPDAAVRDLT